MDVSHDINLLSNLFLPNRVTAKPADVLNTTKHNPIVTVTMNVNG